MSATTPPLQQSQPAMPAADPAVFKILDDGTVLFKTYQQAQNAAQRLKSTAPASDTTKKLSQVKYGEKYLAKDGRVVPYTLGNLLEFQVTGLIVVILVLAGLSLVCAAIGRVIKGVERGKTPSPAAAAAPQATSAVSDSGIHPGLTDQQLVVLLTAAATEAVGNPVRIIESSSTRPYTFPRAISDAAAACAHTERRIDTDGRSMIGDGSTRSPRSISSIGNVEIVPAVLLMHRYTTECW